MITNKQILSEVEQLRDLFQEGENEIPSLWKCFYPGLCVMAWLVAWPITFYSYKFYSLDLPSAAQMGVAISVLIAMVAGLFIMLYIANGRALYLSIPQKFRKDSFLCQFIVTKAKRYGVSYLIWYAVLIVLCAYPTYGAIYSTVLFILSSFGFMVFMNVDLNRYQLTALTSLLESMKSSSASSEK